VGEGGTGAQAEAEVKRAEVHAVHDLSRSRRHPEGRIEQSCSSAAHTTITTTATATTNAVTSRAAAEAASATEEEGIEPDQATAP
jgi:hypothetical protein